MRFYANLPNDLLLIPLRSYGNFIACTCSLAHLPIFRVLRLLLFRPISYGLNIGYVTNPRKNCVGVQQQPFSIYQYLIDWIEYRSFSLVV